MTTKLKRQLSFNHGALIIPAGTQVELTYFKNVFGQVETEQGKKVVSLVKAGDKFQGMVNIPSMKQLEKQFYNDSCVCKTPTGATVEPDGDDEHGFPSFLKMQGLI